MKIRYGIISGLIILAVISLAGVCAAEETTTDTNTISADNPLYGLKIAFEDLDESFTFNATERVEKKLNHANNRLYEYRSELEQNRTDSADQALHQYREKMNQTKDALDPFKPNETGLLHAQEMITKHQEVLEDLLAEHPGNQGLVRAYNNSLQLEEKFEEKTRMHFERQAGENNTTVMRPFPLEENGDNGMKNGNGQQGQDNNGNHNGQGPAFNQSASGDNNMDTPPGQEKKNQQGMDNTENQTGQGPAGNQNPNGTTNAPPGQGNQDQQGQNNNQQQSGQNNGQGNGNQQGQTGGYQQNTGQNGQSNQNSQGQNNIQNRQTGSSQQPGQNGGQKK